MTVLVSYFLRTHILRFLYIAAVCIAGELFLNRWELFKSEGHSLHLAMLRTW